MRASIWLETSQAALEKVVQAGVRSRGKLELPPLPAAEDGGGDDCEARTAATQTTSQVAITPTLVQADLWGVLFKPVMYTFFQTTLIPISPLVSILMMWI
jgi:hypothetical protein